ncbi:DPP IV N-terminal domain-containing protein [candidate division KSB1 bacterium]
MKKFIYILMILAVMFIYCKKLPLDNQTRVKGKINCTINLHEETDSNNLKKYALVDRIEISIFQNLNFIMSRELTREGSEGKLSIELDQGNYYRVKAIAFENERVKYSGESGFFNIFGGQTTSIEIELDWILADFDIITISSPQIINQPFVMTVYAKDSVEATIPTFNNSVRLSDETGTISPSTITLTSGIWSGNVTIDQLYSNNKIKVSYDVGSIEKYSNTFNVESPLTIVDLTLPDGSQGVMYSHTLQATGGTGSYYWSIDSGNLPPGLSLSTAGTISGTPTQYSTNPYTFTVKVISGSQSAVKDFSIRIFSFLEYNTKIAFSVTEDNYNTSEIYIMNPDGSNLKRLTNTPTYSNSNPSWSPDGLQVAFGSNRDGNSEIYVMDTDGSNQINLTSSPESEWYPSWSPDGSQIAYSSRIDSSTEILKMNSNGTGRIQLTSISGADLSPSWSPDGLNIIFISYRDAYWEIYKMQADGSNQTRITYDGFVNHNPSWSPDGTIILFVNSSEGNKDIYIMDNNGSNVQNLTNSSWEEAVPSWSPDGSKIVYSSNRSGSWQLYIMNSDGTDPVRISPDDGRQYNYPSWSPFLH